RLRQLDRRLEQYLDLASSGRLSAERLHALSTELAAQQLEVEDALAAVNRRTRERAARSERMQERERQIKQLTDEWPDLEFPARQALLRELLERVIVHDESIEVVLSERGPSPQLDTIPMRRWP